MEIKYTKDGKKVAVLGKLNNNQWIVQEIFVANGQEFPGGENFVESSLLDEPAKSWKAENEKKLDKRCEEREGVLNKLNEQIEIKLHSGYAADLINQFLEKYENIDPSELQTLFDFMSGKITHLVFGMYGGYKIVSLVDGLKNEDVYHYTRFEGLNLVSLFGCMEDGRRWPGQKDYSLNWKINQYHDGSGVWRPLYPCRSFEDAKAKIDELIADKDATDGLIETKKKYGLKNPTEEKINELRKRNIEEQTKRVEAAKNKLAEAESKLNRL